MKKKVPYVHIVLFLLTFLSTLFFGALQKGANVFSEPSRIIEGFPFSFTLMLILLSHELSHYIASRAHRVEATLPYFLPAPTIIGTFGAVIKMKSPIETRRALIDIGASGPIVGFAVSVAAASAGLFYSEIVVSPETEGVLTLGESLLFAMLSKVITGAPPEGYDILLHPVAFAGWIGFFVTSLNLLPIGQLDGGHIAFALFGGRHRYISTVLVGMLGILGMFFWEGWALWAILMIVFGLRHPPVARWETPLDGKRKITGWLSLLIFVLTFTPVPFSVSG